MQQQSSTKPLCGRLRSATGFEMSFATDSHGLIPLAKSDTPACRWLLSGVKGNDMKLQAEFETAVYLNDDGSVTIQQEGHFCPECGDEIPSVSVFGGPSRLRMVAAELLRMAEAMEAASA